MESSSSLQEHSQSVPSSYQNNNDNNQNETIVLDVTPQTKMEHFEYRDGSSSSSSSSPSLSFEEESPSFNLGLLTSTTLRNLFLLMGAGVLFPYNALLSTCDYFQLLHSNDHHNDVAGELAASCLTALLLTTLILLPLSTPSPTSSQKWLMRVWTSPSKRVLIGFLLGIVLLLLLSLSLLLSLPLSMTSLNITASLFGVADAISQSGLYVLAAKYHNPTYSAAVTLGSAGSGLLVTLLSLFTRALFLQSGEEEEKMEGLRKGSALLFGICAVVILSCIYSLLSIMRDWLFRGGNWDVEYDDVNAASNYYDIQVPDNNGKDETLTTTCTSCPSSPNFVTSSPGIALQKISKKRKQQQQKDDGGDFNEHSPVLQNQRDEITVGEEGKIPSIPKIQSYSGIMDDSTHSDSFLLPPLDHPNFNNKKEEKLQPTKKAKSKQQGKEYHTTSFSNYARLDSASSTTTTSTANYPNSDTLLTKIKHSIVSLSHHPRLHIYTITLSKTWKPTLSLFLNYVVTLSLFPGTIATIKSTSSNEDDDGGGNMWALGDWITIVLLTVFNGADVIGRYLLNVEWLGLSQLLMQTSTVTTVSTGDYDVRHDEQENNENGRSVTHNIEAKTTPDIETTAARTASSMPVQHHPNYNKLVWYQTLARFIFFPLFTYCILPINPHSTNNTITPLISSDILRSILVILFGLTNGFVTCANFMIAPTMVNSESERDASSFLLLMALECGLFVGAYFGLVVDLFLNWMKGG